MTLKSETVMLALTSASKDYEIEINGRKTSVRWLLNTLLQWFGPFDTRVDTGLPCDAVGCNGRLVHVYETVEVLGKQYEAVFTKTNINRRVSTKVHDSCTLPSCQNWGEWVLVGVKKDTALAKAYKKQTRTWRYRK